MQIGIALKKMGITQLTYYLTRSVNELVAQNGMFNATVFHEDWDLTMMVPHFNLMQAVELFGFRGIAIATDLRSAEFLLKCPGPKKKYLYMWDLEWIRNNDSFEKLSQIYNHPSLELIARTDSHAKLIENCWKAPKYIMNDFDTTVFKEIADVK